jgi:tetratricopeptide (TPR) repeat protein
MAVPASFSIVHTQDPPSLHVSGIAVLALLLLGAGIWFFRRTLGPGLWAMIWVVLLLAPSLLVPNDDVFNESRSYLALAGFAFMISSGLFALSTVWRPRLVLAMATCLLLLFAFSATWRNQVWRDDVAIWREAVSHNPEDVRAHYNLGAALSRVGDLDRARLQFEKARFLNPADDLSYAALGYCAEHRGDWFEARKLYMMAVELNPDNSYAQSGLHRIRVIAGEKDGNL